MEKREVVTERNGRTQPTEEPYDNYTSMAGMPSSGKIRLRRNYGNGNEEVDCGTDNNYETYSTNQFIGNLSECEKQIVSSLANLQKTHDRLQQEYMTAWRALKSHYEGLYEPLYIERRRILLQERKMVSDAGQQTTILRNAKDVNHTGISDQNISLDEANTINGTHTNWVNSKDKKKKNAFLNNPLVDSALLFCGTPALPGFWLQCMKGSSTLRNMIEAHDEPILMCLQDIRATWLDEWQNSFKLTFFFSENNPYFTPDILEKRYILEPFSPETNHITSISKQKDPEGTVAANTNCGSSGNCTYMLAQDPVLVRTEATEIIWKPGQDATRKLIEKTQQNRHTKEKRSVNEWVARYSFFNFFIGNEAPSDEVIDKMELDEVNDLEQIMEEEYEAGIILKDKVIPNAVKWYVGDLHEEDDDEEPEENTEDDDESLGEDDDETDGDSCEDDFENIDDEEDENADDGAEDDDDDDEPNSGELHPRNTPIISSSINKHRIKKVSQRC